MKKVVVLQCLLKAPWFKKLKVGSYLPKMIYSLQDPLQADDMEPCIKPTLKNNPERIIIHCRTHDPKNSTPQWIAENILSLAELSQPENNTGLASSIAPRKDYLD